MERISIKAMMRADLGKGACSRIRKTGHVPGVVYKDGEIGVNVQVGVKELWKALHTDAGENAIITMDISGGPGKIEKTVMVKDIQQNPVNDKFVHVDFQEISLSEKISVKVHVVVKGEAPGVKEDGGVFNQALWELEVECLPTQIPEHVDIQVDKLRMGEAIHVKDIPAIPGVVFMDDPDQVVVSVTHPKAEEPEAGAAEGVEGAEEPEIIKKGKKEEEGGEEAAATEEKK
ncbi:MAG: 50S ribosomal protein L25 [Candidatus Omnitrophica bacterium]|nr:50S ribosomal protein L25 [Candidatus Omnitrophota bacterium]MDD4013480.1 50S ribosomal protein L25 [Candidatus Omnitrophota bacterium]